MAIEQSPINYRGYTIKFVSMKATTQSAQGGCAFVVCHNAGALFGLGVKAFTFVAEDITEEIQHQLFEIGLAQVMALLDKGTYIENHYYCYEWVANNPQAPLKEIDCRDPRWGMIPPVLDLECKEIGQ